MLTLIAHGRTLAAAAVVATTGVAGAQSIGFVAGGPASPGVPTLFGGCAATNQGSYGPALFAPNKNMAHRLSANEPYCATKTYPISDWAYIRKYCGPTINPGSCYGHYQTKWRKWEDHCPEAAGPTGCAPDGVVTAMPVLTAPAPQPLTTEVKPAETKPPETKPAEVKPMDVKPDAGKSAEPVAPPKLPPIPKSAQLIPMLVPQDGIPNPIPIALPSAPVPPAELRGVSTEQPALPLPASDSARVVIPPLPDLPVRK